MSAFSLTLGTGRNGCSWHVYSPLYNQMKIKFKKKSSIQIGKNETETEKTQFTIKPKIIKYMGINLTK